ncbi:MAG: PucR family transcriptional regulator [Fastidiosipilaceae bacterium]|jgi:carbohydrate diacid regulator
MEVLKQCIRKAAEFLDRGAGVTDATGTVLVSTDESQIGTSEPDALILCESDDMLSVTEFKTFRKISAVGNPDLVCYIDGTDQVSQTYLEFLCNWLMTALHDGTNESDKCALIKNILLENELPGDIPLKARDHHIPYAVTRTVFLVRVPEANGSAAQEILKDLFPNRRMDFVLAMDETNMVLLKELGEDPKAQIDGIADLVAESFAQAEIGPVYIGVGMTVDTLKDCSRSYREASLALTIGDIFEPDNKTMHYNKLGLGRLIYQLPPTLCRMFLDEVFPQGSYDMLDSETLHTIDKFFENNLNGSETSRQLFVHRNTLVYRLDKVQKITDLDLRNFDDAVLFKLASMVRKYLEKQDPTVLTTGNRW